MTPEELRATYAFQARRDLLLHPLPHLSVDEIVDGVRDEDFVAEHSARQPFHTGISYLLVSMECLIGAAYTKQVQAAGLVGAARPAMGRLDAMNAHLTQLRAGMATVVNKIGPVLHSTDTELLFGEYTRWATTGSWGLINAADPCGT